MNGYHGSSNVRQQASLKMQYSQWVVPCNCFQSKARYDSNPTAAGAVAVARYSVLRSPGLHLDAYVGKKKGS